jgi:hypothetical protein
MRDVRPKRHLRHAAMSVVAALATGLFSLLSAGPVVAQPLANRVVGNCVLSGTAVTGLVSSVQAALQAAGVSPPTARVDFVVVYTLANPNDGQPTGEEFTGPVLCRRPAVGSLPAVQVAPVSQTDPIPATGTVDLLGIENALITQYRAPSGEGDIEKRFCHTVGSTNDCFRISD